MLALLLYAVPQAGTGEDGVEAAAERLERLLYCACPEENWTKTLESCIANCADPQKREIREELSSGASEEEVLSRQREKYGPKVLALADARSHLAIYIFPFLGLLGIGTVVLLRVRRRAGIDPEHAPESRPTSEDDAVRREIEEELSRID